MMMSAPANLMKNAVPANLHLILVKTVVLVNLMKNAMFVVC